MHEDPPSFESRLDALARRLEAVERRLSALENRGSASDAVASVEPVAFEADLAVDIDRAPPIDEPITEGGTPDTERALSAGRGWFTVDALPRYGRTLVVFGGAFLLRAITEAGFVPQTSGTALGLLYAMIWVIPADRDAGRGRLRSATMHGLAAIGIAGLPARPPPIAPPDPDPDRPQLYDVC
jgi:hypothetical protein